jgi:hypothetical protein
LTDEDGFNPQYLNQSHYVAEHNSYVLEHIVLRFILSTSTSQATWPRRAPRASKRREKEFTDETLSTTVAIFGWF